MPLQVALPKAGFNRARHPASIAYWQYSVLPVLVATKFKINLKRGANPQRLTTG
jgi:hypothetical protein